MFRLDCFPVVEQANASAPPTLSCFLCASVRASETLRVTVGDVEYPLVHDGQRLVCAWHCAPQEPMELLLLEQGRVSKAWRGWWQGEGTIWHSGTLTGLRVFCAGEEQPTGQREEEPPSERVASPSTTGHASLNGASPVRESAGAVLAWPPLSLASPVLPDEDDLWSTPQTPVEPPASLAEGESADAGENVGEEDAEDLPAEEDEWEDAPAEEEEEEAASPEEGGEVFLQEALARSQQQPASVGSSPRPAAPAGTMLATCHAASAWNQAEHTRQMDHLASVLEAMPKGTILVDLRQHAAGRRSKQPTPLGLSKEVLRAHYGARYWERGGSIPTVGTMRGGTSGSTGGFVSRWRRVVSPQATGLHELVTALTQGFSLLLLDTTTPYEASGRAAVCDALQQRVDHLTIGPCA